MTEKRKVTSTNGTGLDVSMQMSENRSISTTLHKTKSKQIKDLDILNYKSDFKNN